jgi:hypothetical protein
MERSSLRQTQEESPERSLSKSGEGRKAEPRRKSIRHESIDPTFRGGNGLGGG